MIDRILVPLDQSELAERALEQAVELARPMGATIRLLNVWTPMPPGGGELVPMPVAGTDDRLRLERLRYLERMAAWVRDGSGLPVEPVCRTGFVAETIRDEAASWQADLIVMSTHGRTGWRRMWVGSVADAVVRHSDRPVFLVRPVGSNGRAPDADRVRTVLVPLDGTPESEQVFDAVAMVADRSARCVLLHVVTPAAAPVYVSSVGVPLTVPDEAATRTAVANAERYLARAAVRLRAMLPAARVTTQVVVDDVPDRAIVDAACGVDLAAIATRGHGGTARALLGSVTDALLRDTDVRLVVQHRIPVAEMAVASAWGGGERGGGCLTE